MIFKKQNPFKTFFPPFLSRGRCSEQPPPICRSLPEIYVISVIYLRAPLILGNSRQDQCPGSALQIPLEISGPICAAATWTRVGLVASFAHRPQRASPAVCSRGSISHRLLLLLSFTRGNIYNANHMLSINTWGWGVGTVFCGFICTGIFPV